MKYAVICSVADCSDNSKLNIIVSYEFATKEGAKALAERLIEKDKALMIRAAVNEKIEHPENHAVVIKFENKVRCRYELQSAIKELSYLDTAYDIVELH